MKTFSFAFAALLSMALRCHASETDVQRELQTAKTYWQFVCGGQLILCDEGLQIIDGYKCPTPSTKRVKPRKGTADVCSKLIKAAKYGDALFQSQDYCPNGKRVRKFIKYVRGKGRVCEKGSGCVPCKDGSSFGDPHFITYDGTPYSYHGQCDMVMAQSSDFADGLGFRVHARTKIVTDWSLISNAAVQIGDDVLELTNEGSLFFNGVQVIDTDNELPSNLAGFYNITKQVEMEGDIPKITYAVAMNEDGDERIRLQLFKSMIAVRVGAFQSDIKGMLGSRSNPGLVGRSLNVLDSALNMGAEWQVTDKEPMLFHDIVAPQYPETCMLPQVSARRRLRESTENRRAAEKACAGVSGDEELFNFCVEDVLLTGDEQMALAYAGNP